MWKGGQMDRELQEYLDRGGTITQCPAVETLEPCPKKKGRKQKERNELCDPCPNRKNCNGLCPPMAWINGNVELKEKILSNPYDDRHITEDYNAVLARIIDRVNQNNNNIILQIRAIKDDRTKAIAALLHADFPVRQVAAFVRVSKSSIYRLLGSDETE
jgi:hypothetical protein